jgi:hypothetical protein
VTFEENLVVEAMCREIINLRRDRAKWRISFIALWIMFVCVALLK